jgi:manganese/zinc/iron transport system permease protein
VISYNTLIVLLGTSLLGANAGLVGTFAVLRGRALMGDALAHAALPGLCVAFLLLGYRSLPAMQLGALASGVVGVLIVAALRHGTRIKEDAAIGIVLSVFFGLGIALVRIIQNQTTTGSKAGLDSYIFGKTAGMLASDVYFIAAISAGCLLTVVLLFKEFRVVSFDPAFGSATGLPTFWLDVLLTALISVTVVIGLPAVGVVMVAALLILPAAAARFWTERLGRMVTLASMFGLLVGAVGTSLSTRYAGMPTGPVIVLAGTALFLFSVLVAPRRGMLARLIRHGRLRAKIANQQLLRTLYHVARTGRDERFVSMDSLSDLYGAGRANQILATARRRGYLKPITAGGYELTSDARSQAARIDRAYRLWGLLLSDYPDVVAGMTDLDIESAEENLPGELRGELLARLDLDERHGEGRP